MTAREHTITLFALSLAAMTVAGSLCPVPAARAQSGSDPCEAMFSGSMEALEQAVELGAMTEEEAAESVQRMRQACDDMPEGLGDAMNSQPERAAPVEGLPLSELTLDYLAGTWCKQSGQEDGPWVFAPDGSYEGGMPDSVQGHVMHPLGDSIEDFRGRWHRLESRTQEEFVVYPGRSDTRRTVFTRGECPW